MERWWNYGDRGIPKYSENIQDVSGGIVNILEGGSMDYFE
jgi:hypothetical protein